MTVLDVGEGDSIFLEFPHGGNLLVDAGKGGDSDSGRWVVAPFLKSKGITEIDAMLATHPQEDHIGGMPALLEEFKIKSFFDNGSAYGTDAFNFLQKKIKDRSIPSFHVNRGSKIEGYRNIKILALNPSKEEFQSKDINNKSVVLKIVYQDASFLLTGDSAKGAMEDMLDNGEDVKADVLKVPHHGSRLETGGERFIRAVDPKVSVISVGEHNPFHHPSQATLRALSSIPGNSIFRTDRDKALEIVSDGKKLMVKFLNAD